MFNKIHDRGEVVRVRKAVATIAVTYANQLVAATCTHQRVHRDYMNDIDGS